jgi:thiol-disulfide isomerase/thioredoxin
MIKILKEWGFTLAFLVIFIYLGGPIFLQRILLMTGIYNPSVHIQQETIKADFNFQLLDLEGNTVDFSDWRGNIILINIWATWCGPCVAEMPGLNSLYQKMKNEKIKFVFLSVDEKMEKVQNFLKQKNYQIPVYFLNTSLPSVYKTSNSIPRTYIISKDGRILKEYVGITAYDTKSFQDFLKSLAK